MAYFRNKNTIRFLGFILVLIFGCSEKKDINDTKHYLDSIGKRYSLNILINLKTIEFSKATEISDKGLTLLKELANLERLIIESSKITDIGISSLKDVPNLKYLKIMNSPIGDSIANSLKDLQKLQNLDLINTSVTEKGLEEIQKSLPSVTILCNTCKAKTLDETKVFLDSLKVNFSIDELKNVKKLYLSSKKIQEEKLILLKELKNLKEIDLNYSSVTDKAVEYLKELKGLSFLSLENTNMTDKGYKELQKELASTRILWKEKDKDSSSK
ncbi:MAG: hypothetical protein L6Q54_07800 [Leptospiraceae bacterium]|nr:hypothetical protein [Leptospiraceae bacterium]MCK6381137.1 hypothetical protein [Leptospiraceae bacterium]NUM40573.1 hypothetical protein [Leptospiraceae bacterium]